MKNTVLEQLFLEEGDFRKRVNLSFQRMQEEQYQPENFFEDISFDWQGDHEGRILLALIMTARAAHREPQYLDVILREFPKHFNEHGYLGNLLCETDISEQLLAGHSWMLRAFIELYKWKNTDETLMIIKNIVSNLFMKAKGHYREYPTDRREEIGAEAGNATNRVINCWRISTDTGCAFIALDGLTAVYEMFPDQELKELIEEMIHSFMQIDYKGLKLQTHATLTALRGILRYYNIVKEETLLAYAERVFQDYLDTALTANFANYNWFGRPSWTEPCAIVDSFIVAVELWKTLQDPVYLEVAHKIYFNGMGYAQRPNGGFGCDNCTGPKVDYIRPEDFSFEAYWCCTMRGGDGLARAAEYSYLVNGDTLYVPFYHNNRVTVVFDDGQMILKQQTEYPYAGSVCLQVESCDVTTDKKIRLYMPEFAVPDTGKIFVNHTEIPMVIEDGFVEVDRLLQNGDVIELMFDMTIYEAALRNTALKHKKQWFHGPLLLGTKNWQDTSVRDLKSLAYMGQGAYESSVTGEQWRPINEITFMDMVEARKDKLLICFEE